MLFLCRLGQVLIKNKSSSGLVVIEQQWKWRKNNKTQYKIKTRNTIETILSLSYTGCKFISLEETVNRNEMTSILNVLFTIETNIGVHSRCKNLFSLNSLYIDACNSSDIELKKTLSSKLTVYDFFLKYAMQNKNNNEV